MPKTVDIKAKRAEFIAASLDVIASEGLPAATMRRIAARAGVTTGAITHYFEGREALLVETTLAAHVAAGARMFAAAASAASPAERLEAVVLQALPLDEVRIREWRVWSAFRGAVPGSSRLWAAHEAGYGNWRSYLRTLLEPICGDAEAVRRECSLLVGLVDGIGLRFAAMTASADEVAAEQQSVRSDIIFYLDALWKRQAMLP